MVAICLQCSYEFFGLRRSLFCYRRWRWRCWDCLKLQVWNFRTPVNGDHESGVCGVFAERDVFAEKARPDVGQDDAEGLLTLQEDFHPDEHARETSPVDAPDVMGSLHEVFVPEGNYRTIHREVPGRD